MRHQPRRVYCPSRVIDNDGSPYVVAFRLHPVNGWLPIAAISTTGGPLIRWSI